MKIAPLLPLMICVLCGCAPDRGGPRPAPPRAGKASPAAAASAQAAAALPPAGPASYEVSIASAEADRVRAKDLCDSKPQTERRACNEAADAAYDKAKSAAEDGVKPTS